METPHFSTNTNGMSVTEPGMEQDPGTVIAPPMEAGVTDPQVVFSAGMQAEVPAVFQGEGETDDEKATSIQQKLKPLQDFISRHINASESAVRDYTQQWEEGFAIAANRFPGQKMLPFKDAVYREVPLAGVKLDQRRVSLVSAIIGSDKPVFRFVNKNEPDAAERVTAVVQYILQLSDFRTLLDRLVYILLATNVGVIRTTFQQGPSATHSSTHIGPFSAPVLEIIEPRNFVLSQETSGGIHSAAVVGHRFDMRRSLAKAYQKTGAFLPYNALVMESQTTIQQNEDRNGPRNSAVQEMETETTTLYDLYVRYDADGDGLEETYRVITTKDTGGCPLLVTELNSPFPNYTVANIKYEPGRLFPQGAPAKDAIDIQLSMSDMINWMIWSANINAVPPFIARGMNKSEKFLNHRPGQVSVVNNVTDLLKVPASMQLNDFANVLGLLRNMMDMVMKTPENITGGSAVRGTTATEAEIKLRGFQLAGLDDVNQIAPALRDVGRQVFLSLKEYMPNFLSIHKLSLPAEFTAMDLEHSYTLVLQGESIETDPDAIIQRLQTFMALILQLEPMAGQAIKPVAGPIVGLLLEMIAQMQTFPKKEDIVAILKDLASRLSGEPPPGAMPQVAPDDVDPMQEPMVGDMSAAQPIA